LTCCCGCSPSPAVRNEEVWSWWRTVSGHRGGLAARPLIGSPVQADKGDPGLLATRGRLRQGTEGPSRRPGLSMSAEGGTGESGSVGGQTRAECGPARSDLRAGGNITEFSVEHAAERGTDIQSRRRSRPRLGTQISRPAGRGRGGGGSEAAAVSGEREAGEAGCGQRGMPAWLRRGSGPDHRDEAEHSALRPPAGRRRTLQRRPAMSVIITDLVKWRDRARARHGRSQEQHRPALRRQTARMPVKRQRGWPSRGGGVRHV